MNSTVVTQEQLDTFKSLHVGNRAIQSLTLSALVANTKGAAATWGSLQLKSPAALGPSVRSVPSLTDCQMKVGYVVFDAICLAVGAVGLRAAVNTRTIEGVFRAAAPAMGRIEAVIAEMAAQGASNTDRAFGVFRILSAIYSANCLGAVFAAFTDSLTWWDMILYGISGTATIVAALATDGVAFVAEVVILLATFGFLVSDSVSAVQTCSIPASKPLNNGDRLRDETDGAIYLTLDSALRHVPDPQTYTNLFKDWSSVKSVPNVDGYLVGTPLTEDASLVSGTPDGKVFLLLEGGKRWITSPAVFDRYGFNWGAIKPVPADQLNAIPTGDELL